MVPIRLRVNTDVHRETVVASKKLAGPSNATSSTLFSQSHSNGARARSGSTASTSSSISLVSPCPSSSASASSSSLHLPGPGPASSQPISQSNSRPATPSADETVRVHTSVPEYVLALHDFVPQQQNATCLSFHAGQVIRVFNRDPSGWWDGELHGQRGWFPSNYVSADERVISLTEEQLRPSVSIACFYACFVLTSVVDSPSLANLRVMRIQCQLYRLHRGPLPLRAAHLARIIVPWSRKLLVLTSPRIVHL